MNDTLSYSGTLVVLTCWCGMRHAVPEELRRYQLRSQDDGRAAHSIFCPLGHEHIPSGKSTAQKLREQLDAASLREQQVRDQLSAAERSRSALKGELTKAKKRVGNGVCPCCNRTFANVTRHMHTKHPDYKNAAGDAR